MKNEPKTIFVKFMGETDNVLDFSIAREHYGTNPKKLTNVKKGQKLHICIFSKETAKQKKMFQGLGRNSRHLKQWSDIWALSRLKYTFLWKHPFELIFHNIFTKKYRFNFFMTKSLRKSYLRQNLDFCQSIFNFSAEIEISNLHLE